MDKKEQARERMRRMRERNKSVPDSVTPGDNVTQDVTQDVTQRLFTPSKFLSEEEDLRVEQRVRDALMSGSRLSQFQGLRNSFTPNKKRDLPLPEPL